MSQFWRNRRIFVTGHTGFKGGWLSLWLHRLGARVSGYSLAPPTQPNLFDLARVGDVAQTTLGDVRDLPALSRALAASDPEVVFHLAAQPLVLGGYSDPVGTFDTNLMGTVNLFQAVRSLSGLRAIVNVTTDKCYENRNTGAAFREGDPLGGIEPYGASKACSEIATEAFARSFFPPDRHAEHGVAIATGRAGNVIGGGDWGENRLVPDVVRSFLAHDPVRIRRPDATRPWQHVLEPLSGYLKLARRLVDSGPKFGGGWNFGPDAEAARPVSWVVDECVKLWGGYAPWEPDAQAYPPEARLLHLDCSKAKSELGWSPRLPLMRSLALTIAWYRSADAGRSARELCEAQIEVYGDEELR